MVTSAEGSERGIDGGGVNILNNVVMEDITEKMTSEPGSSEKRASWAEGTASVKPLRLLHAYVFEKK